MKKLVIVALLALSGIYGIGYVSLGETGAVRLLNDMLALTADGNGHGLCELYADDLQVNLN
ncbi:MAG TPA: hypothetical protein VK629_09950, partial [Steroidobacteraceae bacterium]|nr:hypothetical protein [Steroidobacteraceae bacterium]